MNPDFWEEVHEVLARVPMDVFRARTLEEDVANNALLHTACAEVLKARPP